MFHISCDIVHGRDHVSRHFFSNKVPADVELNIGHRISERKAQNRHAISLGHEVIGMYRGRLIEINGNQVYGQAQMRREVQLTSTNAGKAGSVQATKVSEGSEVPFDPMAER